MHKKFLLIFFNPILISIIFITATFLLGLWQLQRLNWKNSLIKDFDNLKASIPVDLALVEKKEFTKIKTKGIINRNNKVFFPAKTYNGKAGMRLVSEFISENGDIYLVDEGWFNNFDFEYFKKNNDNFQENILGYIRFPRKAKLFTPENNILKNEWYTYDLQEISNFFSSTLNQSFFIKKINSNKEIFLFPSTQDHKLRNNHLQYAITWFCMSLAFIFLFLVYLKKNKDE